MTSYERNGKMRRYWTGAFAAAGITALLLAPSLTDPPASSAEEVVEIAGEDLTTGNGKTIVTQRFDHPLSLDDAVRLAAEDGIDAKGYRIENDSIVSEYWPDPSLTVEEYRQWFSDLYGTEPQVVGVMVQTESEPVPVDGLESKVADDPSMEAAVELPPVLETDLPAFDAPEPSEGDAWEQLEGEAGQETPTDSTADAAAFSVELAPGTTVPATAELAGMYFPPVDYALRWAPDSMETRIERWGDRQYFYMFANWGYGSSARSRPQSRAPQSGEVVDYGMEFGVSLHNAEGGTRPNCDEASYGNFIALNRGYSWGVTMGRDSYASQLGAYADTNDLFDACGKQSMSIGLSQPWNMPERSDGTQQILISINAKPGYAQSSRISGDVQLVDNLQCKRIPSMSLTDCMGVFLSKPDNTEGARTTLAQNRFWLASPNKCWLSMNHGRSTPTLSSPTYPYNGCYQG